MSRVLMVPPDHFEVVYEINPWMSRARPAAREKARRQWEALVEILRGPIGAEVLLAPPQPCLPDMVFTANAGLVCGDRVVLSNFRHPERQGETPHFRAWFQDHGYQTVDLPAGRNFEGEGDALFLGDTLFAGYFWRTDVRSHLLVGEELGVRVLSLQLVDSRFYHLDTCFCPIDEQTLVYFPLAFDEYGRRVIEANVPHRIEVEEAEAERFACNSLVIGKSVVLNEGSPKLEARLRELGYTTYATPLDEFLKAGGSAKCLTLHLDREARSGQRPLNEPASSGLTGAVGTKCFSS